MAFHGASRGNSRGNSRGRGNGQFRGRGGNTSGRGAGRGNGRGGRGGGRGRRPMFDSARVAEKRSEGSDNDSEESESSVEEGDTEEEEAEGMSSDEEEPVIRSYTALMQTFSAESGPQAKRRKLNTSGTPRFQESKKNDTPLEAETDADLVEEAEEGLEAGVHDLLESEDEKEDLTGPFEAHFAHYPFEEARSENSDESKLSTRLRELQQSQWSTQNTVIPKIGKVTTVTLPREQLSESATTKINILGPKDLKLKQKLANVYLRDNLSFNPLEKTVADVMFNYQDMLFCGRTPSNAQELRRLMCLHAVNHVFKTRDSVIKHSARLAQSDGDLEFQDQGFTRPKVLMLLPTKESCVKMVAMITALCEPEQQENRKRFEDEFVDKEEKFAEKPEDFRDLLGGNSEDMFRLGLKFTRKTVKYYSQFYNSDIIFASPLGLRMAIGTEEEKKVDYDFLSSIELVIVEQADGLLMQNWEHTEFVFDHLNLQPKEAHNCDFSRVRKWYLGDDAKYFRQTIALASFNTPELNTTFFHQSKNWAGRCKISGLYPGAIQELGMKVKQTFSRLDSPSFATEPETRFTYFTSAIIPTLTRNSRDSGGTLIFIPSYLDFVQIRNYFSSSTTATSLSFGSICEYTQPPDVSRARSHFLTGRHKVLLYTERAHHFHRHILRGVKKIIMYGLPDNPIFYKEIVGGYLGKSVVEGKLEMGEGNVRVVFSKWDLLKLERVVGSERVRKMIQDKGDTFNFL